MDPEFWSSLVVCVAMVGAALWLIHVHWEHWQEAEADTSLSDRDRDHLKRRHRRRMQTSTMFGVVGIAILAGRLFPLDEPSVPSLLYWTGVLLLVLWMALLAMADIVATRVHFNVQRRKTEGERARLEAKLRRFEREQVEKTDSGDSAEEPSGRDGS